MEIIRKGQITMPNNMCTNELDGGGGCDTYSNCGAANFGNCGSKNLNICTFVFVSK